MWLDLERFSVTIVGKRARKPRSVLLSRNYQIRLSYNGDGVVIDDGTSEEGNVYLYLYEVEKLIKWLNQYIAWARQKEKRK